MGPFRMQSSGSGTSSEAAKVETGDTIPPKLCFQLRPFWALPAIPEARFVAGKPFSRCSVSYHTTANRKRRAEALPGPQGRKKTTLLGTNPDRYYFCFLRASIIRPDFHWLAALNPSVRTHAGKTGHSDFNLKFRASWEIAVSLH